MLTPRRLIRRPAAAALLWAAFATLSLSATLVDEYKSGINWAEPVVIQPGPVGGPLRRHRAV